MASEAEGQADADVMGGPPTRTGWHGCDGRTQPEPADDVMGGPQPEPAGTDVMGDRTRTSWHGCDGDDGGTVSDVTEFASVTVHGTRVVMSPAPMGIGIVAGAVDPEGVMTCLMGQRF